MRDAERGSSDQVFAFIAVDRFQIEGIVAFSGKEALAEVVDFSFFRGEVCHGKGSGTYFEPRLPVNAEMVLAGIGGDEEIRTAVSSSHPRAIHSHFSEGVVHVGQESSTITRAAGAFSLDYIDQSLAGLGLGRGVLGRVLPGFEFNVFRATSNLCAGDGGLILSESRSGEKDYDDSGFYGDPPGWKCAAD